MLILSERDLYRGVGPRSRTLTTLGRTKGLDSAFQIRWKLLKGAKWRTDDRSLDTRFLGAPSRLSKDRLSEESAPTDFLAPQAYTSGDSTPLTTPSSTESGSYTGVATCQTPHRQMEPCSSMKETCVFAVLMLVEPWSPTSFENIRFPGNACIRSCAAIDTWRRPMFSILKIKLHFRFTGLHMSMGRSLGRTTGPDGVLDPHKHSKSQPFFG
jgi:hypothetical protein